MAKKKKAPVEGEEEEAKGGKKKMIIIGVLVVAGLFGAKTMLMKPASPAVAAAAKVAKEQALVDLCARQNTPFSEEPKPAAATATTVAGTTATTVAVDPRTERGGVLEMDPLTVNLADGHYLKVGIALQLDKVGVVLTAKDDGLGAKALDMAIAALSPKTMKQLSEPKAREALKRELGVDTCMAYEGEVLTVYFTNFVMQ
jgi:flagellar basal body-associated protein FliL